MAPKKNSKSFHYPMVDALRGLAALTIVVYHVIEIIKWENFPLSGPLGALFRAGWMAVDLFLVVSGFVIAISAKRCYDGAASPGEFWKVYFLKRFFRIAPLHFLTCGIFLIFISPATTLRPDGYLSTGDCVRASYVFDAAALAHPAMCKLRHVDRCVTRPCRSGRYRNAFYFSACKFFGKTLSALFTFIKIHRAIIDTIC